jgi:hypothetical protein
MPEHAGWRSNRTLSLIKLRAVVHCGNDSLRRTARDGSCNLGPMLLLQLVEPTLPLRQIPVVPLHVTGSLEPTMQIPL